MTRTVVNVVRCCETSVAVGRFDADIGLWPTPPSGESLVARPHSVHAALTSPPTTPGPYARRPTMDQLRMAELAGTPLSAARCRSGSQKHQLYRLDVAFVLPELYQDKAQSCRQLLAYRKSRTQRSTDTARQTTAG